MLLCQKQPVDNKKDIFKLALKEWIEVQRTYTVKTYLQAHFTKKMESFVYTWIYNTKQE